VEHHNRLSVLERVADNLLAVSDRMERDASRQESRVDHLRKMVEQKADPEACPASSITTQALSSLPFGSVESPGPDAVIWTTVRYLDGLYAHPDIRNRCIR